MTFQFLIALAWTTGLFLSPEALLLQGNLSGQNGLAFVPLLAVALMLHWTNASAMHREEMAKPAAPSEIRLLTKAFGPFAASALLWMARPVLAVCLATAVLVTAGFVFNEVFLYWFPNFGFAALLMTAILALNLAGPRTAAAGQVVFTFTAVAGLTGLAVAGLFDGGQSFPERSAHPSLTSLSRGVGLAAITFVGYDMLRYSRQRLDQDQLTKVVKTGLLLGGLVYFLWNTAAVLHVAPSRLAGTSIPHVLVAKAIAGSNGRIVIGIVAIAGACAAVNYLFQALASMLATMARSRLLPTVFGHSPHRPTLALFSFSAILGLLMATGFAGSDWLDVSIRAGLLLWLVFYAIVLLAGRLKQSPGRTWRPEQPSPRERRGPVGVASVMLVIAGTLGATDDAPAALFQAITVILALAVALAGAGLFLAGGMGMKPKTGSQN